MARLTIRELFVDTSVLLAGIIDFGQSAKPAQALMDRVAEGSGKPLTAWHCCLEFYSVATRLPEEYRLMPADATLIVLEELLGRFSVRDLPSRSRKSFVDSLPRDAVAGGKIYDAHIADIARHSGAAAVVTENQRDFITLLRHGVPVLSPTEALDRL
ncbi:MAG: PIN domain-containing protein [Acidobacteria bacterium]|nr:PIN domain-containing protein [Acidobacteriota bacterium]